MEEITRYVYATDTTGTGNASLPWKNKTTIPKICQISDNLLSNYILTLTPKDKYVTWIGNTQDANSLRTQSCIKNLTKYWMRHPSFKQGLYRCLQDYVYKGNAVAMPEWRDERVQQKDK